MAKGFNGVPGGNIQGLMQQAQRMQKDMQKAQVEAEGSAGGGAVKCKVNGKYEILTVEIKAEAVDPSDVELLQDMIRAATNDALAKIKSNFDQKLSSVTGGVGVPGLF